MPRPLSLDASLADASRLPALRSADQSALSAVALFFFGALTAVCVCLVEINLKMPGHAILRAAIPMALGLALCPRRSAGVAMGVGAATVGLGLHWSGIGERGLGSLTSLLILGPMLDLAVAWSRRGRSLVVALVLAGLGANLVALGVQAGAKSLGLDSGGGKSVSVWILKAGWTYPFFGALAGLLGGASLFRFGPLRASEAARNGTEPDAAETDANERTAP